MRFHARYDDIKLHRENMVTGPGSKELIFLVFTTFSGGEGRGEGGREGGREGGDGMGRY